MATLEIRIGDYVQGNVRVTGGLGDGSPASEAKWHLQDRLKLVEWAEVVIEITGSGMQLGISIVECPAFVRKYIKEKVHEVQAMYWRA